MPWISFSGVSIASSVLTAGPAPFNLSIPLLGANLDLRVDGTRLESPVTQGANGPTGGLAMGGDDGAKLGGYVAIETVAVALNQYLDASCTCITKKDPAKPYVATKIAASKVKLDTSNFGSGASCEASGPCGQIASLGGLLSSLINPDVDGDEDGTIESLSVGVRLKATSATVSSVMCEADPQ
jgi:hypothetical protein